MSQHTIENLQPNHHGPKRRGELAELAFMYRASSEGISVAKPYGDGHPYDFLVQNGRLLRIQVKSTFRDPNVKGRRNGYQIIVARLGKAKCITHYSCDEIDFVICFIAPLDIWYIVPVEVLGRRQGKGQPFGGLFEDYREAWGLLKDEDSSTNVCTSEGAEPPLEAENSTTTG